MIDVNNRPKANTVVDGEYEYKQIQLEQHQESYVRIPVSVITNTELDERRVGAFSYLRVHCGLNKVVNLTIPDMVTWCGGKPNNRADGANVKMLSIMDAFMHGGYFTYLTDVSKSSYMKCEFDEEYYRDECSLGYSAVYIDELEKIMNYQKENARDNRLNNTTILLVFAYLRYKIMRRPNRLKPEERSSEGIQKRRERMPEAYDAYINDIANELGISSKTTSKIIDILEQELELIVTDRAYRVKNEDNEFRTMPTIFANAYKRNDKYYLYTGDDYSRTEIELKAEQMKKYYQGYRINKTKRKTK